MCQEELSRDLVEEERAGGKRVQHHWIWGERETDHSPAFAVILPLSFCHWLEVHLWTDYLKPRNTAVDDSRFSGWTHKSIWPHKVGRTFMCTLRKTLKNTRQSINSGSLWEMQMRLVRRVEGVRECHFWLYTSLCYLISFQ